VVGVISPFNVPIILGIRSVAPALALGNAVLLKPDPRTAVTGGVVMARIFQEAGLPRRPAAGAGRRRRRRRGHAHRPAGAGHLVHRLDRGRPPGRRARRQPPQARPPRARRQLGDAGLDDADVDAAVNLAAWGSFFHQGQICMTTGRHLVHERLYDDFVERLADKAAKLPVGDPAREPGRPRPDHRRPASATRIHDLSRPRSATAVRVAAGGSYDRLFYSPRSWPG
jgi:benzaldehyde dehydrogenase (NAD)